MIKHLIYNIPRGYKVGYGALFTKIFQECGLDLSDEPIILPRDENLFGKHSMVLFKFSFVGGKLVDNVVVENEEEAIESDQEVVKKCEVKGTKPTDAGCEEVGETKADKKVGTSAKKEQTKKRAHTPSSKPECPIKRCLVRKKKAEPTKQEKKKETSSSKDGAEEVAAEEPQPANTSGSTASVEQLFALIMAKLLDLQTAQLHMEAEIGQIKQGQQSLGDKLDVCVSKIDLLDSKLSSLQQVLLDKMILLW